MTAFVASVERWRKLCEEYGSGAPVDFLLSWIKHESGGNPCSTGIPGVEAGLFQLYYPDDERYGGTFTKCRAGCSGVPGELATPTNANGVMHVRAGCNYVRAARDVARSQLSSVGASWPEDSRDFWCLVKLRHALPSLGKSLLPAFKKANGRAPATWNEWRDFVYAMTPTQVVAANKGLSPWSSLSQRQRLLGNAEKTCAVDNLTPLPDGPSIRVLGALVAIMIAGSKLFGWW